jgi:ABC-type microcin C transport system duplicated ATPase subunit YejF
MHATDREFQALRVADLAMIFQDPMTARASRGGRCTTRI